MVCCDSALRAARPQAAPAIREAWAASYRALLHACFNFFNTVRVFTYLPTMWAIYTSGSSEQHSLVTWCMWLGANLSMAGWLYEHNAHRVNRAVLVTLANGIMNSLCVVMIVSYRL